MPDSLAGQDDEREIDLFRFGGQVRRLLHVLSVLHALVAAYFTRGLGGSRRCCLFLFTSPGRRSTRYCESVVGGSRNAAPDRATQVACPHPDDPADNVPGRNPLRSPSGQPAQEKEKATTSLLLLLTEP